jgi:hypothetical protein
MLQNQNMRDVTFAGSANREHSERESNAALHVQNRSQRYDNVDIKTEKKRGRDDSIG